MSGNSDSMFDWRTAVLKSTLPPTTRHVLLTLACHMNAVGESCFPSIKLLCEETGLSNRAVITHLQGARELGWITVKQRVLEGQRWAAHQYFPAWPHYLREVAESFEKAMNDVHQLSKKAVNEVHKDSNKLVNVIPKAVNLTQKGGEPSDEKAVNEVHTSNSMSNPESNSISTSVNLFSPDETGEFQEKAKGRTNAVWETYNKAYFDRYGTNAVRNRKVNGQLADFIERVGAKEAPHIAAFYVTHNDRDYVKKSHPVGLLVSNAEGLRTQWATGRTMTSTRANQLDSTATNANAAQEAIAMLRRRNGNASV